MIKDLGSKIILSLSYTDQFKYPLTKEEIFLRLIGRNNPSNSRELESELANLVSIGKIFSNQDFYYLEGSDGHIETRLKRKEYSQEKWLEVKEFVNFAKHIPWIKGILITGSLAVDNAKKNDDIDFLIIAQENRLWIVRVLVVAFAFIKGKKRSWNGEDANTWCLNLWLEDGSLRLPERLRNIYGAFEICQAIWVHDKGNTKNNFFKLNGWAKEFLPNYFSLQSGDESDFSGNKGENDSGNLSTFNFLLHVLNKFLFFLQYLYMRPHMTSERVSKNFAFFHPRDTKRQVLGRWLKKFKKII